MLLPGPQNKSLPQNSNGVVIAASSQPSAEGIKNTLSLRNEPVQAVTHQALDTLSEIPSLLVLDTNALQLSDSLKTLIHKVPTLVLASQFEEEAFLTFHEWGVLDYLVAPAPSYLLAKVLDSLKQQQYKHQVSRYQDLLMRLGAISERSGTLSTSHLLKMLEDSIAQYYLNPDEMQSLLVVSWSNMPSPCPKALQEKIYQTIASRLKDAARTNDWVGEFLEEKFVILLPNTPITGVNALASRVATKLKEPIATHTDSPVTLSFRLGGAQYQEGQHYENWLQHAFQKLTSIS